MSEISQEDPVVKVVVASEEAEEVEYVEHTEKSESKPKPDNPMAALAQMAADKGKRMSVHEERVFEGCHQGNMPKPSPTPEPTSPQLHGKHLVGAVRVLPTSNDEMQKILAARLRKGE